jgi:serine/threonine protein kinase
MKNVEPVGHNQTAQVRAAPVETDICAPRVAQLETEIIAPDDAQPRPRDGFAHTHRPEETPIATSVCFSWRHLVVFDQLGSGGFGDVFRAFDATLKREVALKLRRSNHQLAPAAGRAFIEEARRLAQVRHPNVLAVHGAAFDQGRVGIWTDLIIGQTLSRRVDWYGPLSANALLQLLIALSAALEAVHAKAIVHGDLKPANVMQEAAAEGDVGRFVLMDFGAGATLDQQATARLQAGTLHYMAPEQRAGAALGTSADIYALGATAYFAATGESLSRWAECAPLVLASEVRAQLRSLWLGEPLAQELSALIADTLAPAPDARPSAGAIQSRCYALLGEPARRKQQRLRQRLSVILMSALIVICTAMMFTLKARSEIVLERNRAVKVRDFLLTMVRNVEPLPPQAAPSAQSNTLNNSNQHLSRFFEKAVSDLPSAFGADYLSQAKLLNQFGRSLLVLDQDAGALTALLRADALLESARIPHTDEGRVDTRSYIGRAYRIRRDYGKATLLANQQAQLCAGSMQLMPRSCLQIVNDQIQAVGYGGDSALALTLVAQNLNRAKAANLEGDDRAVFGYFLQSWMRRDLADYSGARASMLTLVDRTLTASQKNPPGMLFNLMWLASSADDLGDIELARAQ